MLSTFAKRGFTSFFCFFMYNIFNMEEKDKNNSTNSTQGGVELSLEKKQELERQEIRKKKLEEEKKEQERTKVGKNKFLKSFRDFYGSISATCQTIGIDRKTYYNWRESDEKFAEECDKIRWLQLDYTEDKLLKKVRENSLGAIMFLLQHRHPEYTNKLTIDNENQMSVEKMLVEIMTKKIEYDKEQKQNKTSKSE